MYFSNRKGPGWWLGSALNRGVLCTGLIGTGLVGSGLVGCGGGTPASPQAAASATAEVDAQTVSSTKTVAPAAGNAAAPAAGTAPAGTAAVNDEPDEPEVADDNVAPVVAEPDKGSPEWIIREILKVRLQPYPALPTAEKAAKDPQNAELQAQLKKELDGQKSLRAERNQQIIALASEAIAKTAKDADKERLFTVAVHHLLDAHYQLALQGDAASIEALYEAADVFFERRGESEAAMDAQLTLVNLAHSNAMRYGQNEPKWLQEFARQSQMLATRFPKEQAKALPLVLAAGTSCELHNLQQDALACYRLLQTKFPESAETQQIAGVLRRLDLPGKPLELAGPTIDGNFLSMDDLKGKATLVVFWSSSSKPFADQLPQLTAITKKYEKYCQVVGINLDVEEPDVDKFMETTGLTWPTIFYSERDKRGWSAPLAAHYGVNTVPSVWLIDPQGVVVSTNLQAETMESPLREALLKFYKPTAQKAADSASK